MEMDEDGYAHDVEDEEDASDGAGSAPVVPPKKRGKTKVVRTRY